MGEELRLRIVDKIWGLPDEFLQGLSNHIDAIERAKAGRPVNPLVRGKAK